MAAERDAAVSVHSAVQTDKPKTLVNCNIVELNAFLISLSPTLHKLAEDLSSENVDGVGFIQLSKTTVFKEMLATSKVSAIAQGKLELELVKYQCTATTPVEERNEVYIHVYSLTS